MAWTTPLLLLNSRHLVGMQHTIAAVGPTYPTLFKSHAKTVLMHMYYDVSHGYLSPNAYGLGAS